VTGVADAAQGRPDHIIHRDPVATLAAILDADHPAGSRFALATATESADDTRNVRTPAGLLADAAQLAATERTGIWLDQLATLTCVLRRAELTGHDPCRVLHDAVADRPLDGATPRT
jgi:hypothetical protein